MKLKPGMQAPEIGLPDASGKMWTLSDLAGSPAIVYFYPADDTPGCTAEACDFRDATGSFTERDASKRTRNRPYVLDSGVAHPVICLHGGPYVAGDRVYAPWMRAG